MVRMLGHEETRDLSGADALVEERVSERVTPTADEVRALVEGPRRPIRWMRWLSAIAVIAGGAVVVALVTSNDDTDGVQYLTPTSADATDGTLTRSMYLPETSGEVYNYNPPSLTAYDVTPEAGGPTRSAYLPETPGEVYNYNPPSLMVYDGTPEAGGPPTSTYLPETSGEVYNYNPAG